MRFGRRGALLAAGVGLLAAACETLPPPAPVSRGYPPPPPPPPPPTAAELLAAEFAWSAQPGPDAIQGAAAYRGPGGAYSCAGQSVALAPQTRTSAEHMRTLYGSAQSAVLPVEVVRAHSAGAPGPDFSRWVRTTTCDAHGRFAFEGLPDGGYFIIARLHPRGRADGPALAVLQRVALSGGGVRQVLLPER